MALTISEATGAACWACYLINGDESGIEQREVALCDAWQARLAPAYVCGIASDESGETEEPWFTWSYGLYTGDDCSGGNCLTYMLCEA